MDRIWKMSGGDFLSLILFILLILSIQPCSHFNEAGEAKGVVISLPTIFSLHARQAGSYQTAINLQGMGNFERQKSERRC
jgi:hypothetical protein